MKLTRRESVQRRHGRIRRSIFGTPERPRLSIFRSNQHIYAQVIDDTKHSTLAAASTLDPELRKGLTESGANTCEASAEVGKLIAQRSLEKGVNQVVFDRGGNLYHGRIQALAEAAREAGLDF